MIENSIATDDMGFDMKTNRQPDEGADSMIEMWKCPKC